MLMDVWEIFEFKNQEILICLNSFEFKPLAAGSFENLVLEAD